MVLIRKHKGAKIILHAKLPTFTAAKLKGFTVRGLSTKLITWYNLEPQLHAICRELVLFRYCNIFQTLSLMSSEFLLCLQSGLVQMQVFKSACRRYLSELHHPGNRRKLSQKGCGLDRTGIGRYRRGPVYVSFIRRRNL